MSHFNKVFNLVVPLDPLFEPFSSLVAVEDAVVVGFAEVEVPVLGSSGLGDSDRTVEVTVVGDTADATPIVTLSMLPKTSLLALGVTTPTLGLMPGVAGGTHALPFGT